MMVFLKKDVYAEFSVISHSTRFTKYLPCQLRLVFCLHNCFCFIGVLWYTVHAHCLSVNAYYAFLKSII